MPKAKQTGKIKVMCNVCKKTAELATAEYYKTGGFRGGCCKETKLVNAVVDGVKTKKEITIGNTWSTIQVK
jgi:hypothetical protein